jgi:bacteriocin-like protein
MNKPDPKNVPASTPDEMIQPGITGATELSEKELEGVSGGALKIKIAGVDGEAKDKDHKSWVSL